MDAGVPEMKRGSRRGGRWLVAAALSCSAILAHGQEESLEFTGTTSKTTATFDVEAPWIIDWRVFSDFPQSMSIELSLLNAATGLHEGSVVQTKQMGNGVKLFRESGSYQLRIDSDLARWQIIVKELTEEEAEQYKPKENRRLLNNPFRQRDSG